MEAALKFAQEGAKVAAARRENRSQAVLRKIEARGGVGLFITTDLTHRAEVAALVEARGPHS